MRKSFKLIVFISVSAILSLVLALFIAPLRSSFSEYSNKMKDKAANAVNVNFNGANNGIGAVNRNRIESTIKLGSIKSSNIKKAKITNNNRGISAQGGISYSLHAYAQRIQGAKVSGVGSRVSGVLANSSNDNSSTAIQGALGINSTSTRNNIGINSPALIGFNTLTTDLTSMGLASQGGPQAAGKNPPPEEGEGGTPSLPIGDGTLLMLAMAMAFVGLKIARNLKISNNRLDLRIL